MIVPQFFVKPASGISPRRRIPPTASGILVLGRIRAVPRASTHEPLLCSANLFHNAVVIDHGREFMFAPPVPIKTAKYLQSLKTPPQLRR
jgi:hypothetical protein